MKLLCTHIHYIEKCNNPMILCSLKHSVAFLCIADLGEEAAVVSGQNHLHYIFQPLQTQHVCRQYHLTVGQETPNAGQFVFWACIIIWDIYSHTQYLALAPEGRSTMAPYMYWSKISISSGPKLKGLTQSLYKPHLTGYYTELTPVTTVSL